MSLKSHCLILLNNLPKLCGKFIVLSDGDGGAAFGAVGTGGRIGGEVNAEIVATLFTTVWLAVSTRFLVDSKTKS